MQETITIPEPRPGSLRVGRFVQVEASTIAITEIHKNGNISIEIVTPGEIAYGDFKPVHKTASTED